VFVVPLWRHLPGLAVSVQVLLVLLAVPLTALAVCCLASAAKPGIVGQLRRSRR
jgi:hypothetical protein